MKIISIFFFLYLILHNAPNRCYVTNYNNTRYVLITRVFARVKSFRKKKKLVSSDGGIKNLNFTGTRRTPLDFRFVELCSIVFVFSTPHNHRFFKALVEHIALLE